jgi:hypothetical protein
MAVTVFQSNPNSFAGVDQLFKKAYAEAKAKGPVVLAAERKGRIDEIYLRTGNWYGEKDEPRPQV